ncbi:hypothetical protein [Actinoplanes sp. NPDC026670]|uniref:hypothetical protein n=1 Tax=Actinoplanes sp. NPDC026670 TaxID=3154700 RepID=UPI0033F1BD50
MTATPAKRAGNAMLIIMIVVVALAECLLALLGAMAWQGRRDGGFTPEEAMPFTVMGLSAAVGVLLAMFAIVALLRGPRGQGLARVTAGLAWLRLGGVILALTVGALTFGVSAVAAAFPAFGVVLAVGDAIGGLVVAGAAVRRTRNG